MILPDFKKTKAVDLLELCYINGGVVRLFTRANLYGMGTFAYSTFMIWELFLGHKVA